MQLRVVEEQLAEIPVLDVGPHFALETLKGAPAHSQALMSLATRGVPNGALKMADAISRRWLEKSGSPHLAEIDEIAAHIRRPGAYFLNVNYEWGCTVGLKNPANGSSPRLARVLDWRTPGLGRHVIAARIKGQAGPWVSFTWPGYTGVLQAMAPQRFAAALNQAPMATPVGVMPLDWAVNRRRVWTTGGLTPAHLLRRAFEEAASYKDARALLIATPISAPAIFSLVGLLPNERCVIERLERSARVREEAATAANHWSSGQWSGRPRGQQSALRAQQMEAAGVELEDAEFAWLTPPMLNDRTRLAFVADPARGTCIARGYEAGKPATRTLRLAF